jgi:hypothetical protein
LSPARGAVLVVGGLFALLVIGYGTVSLVAVLARTSYERVAALEPAAQRLTVRTDSGSVELLPSADSRVHVEASVTYGLGEPDLVMESDGAGVRVEGRCGSFALTNCSVDLVVRVPPDFDIRAHSSADDVEARDVSGQIRLTSSAGEVRVDGAAGILSLRSSAGGVEAVRLRSSVVDATSSAGDVRLRFVTAPDDVRATTSAGDVEVALPAGSGPYAVDASTSAGDERVDVPTDAGATRRVRARSSAGDVRVRATPAG